jgi:NAD(P)-dependent dehydrogenase (short-subunit alcohol dehydrogenase family)
MDRNMNLGGKRVLVTGSMAGIARATVQLFLEAGATVALQARTTEEVDHELAGLTTAAIAVTGDVSTIAGCAAVVDGALSRMGGLDVLVNATEICPSKDWLEVTEADWDVVIGANMQSALFCSSFALDGLKKSGGCIVNLGSTAGLCAGPPDNMLYAISKAGLIHMTKALAIELAPAGVRVNAVCPGYIADASLYDCRAALTGNVAELVRAVTPLGRPGTAHEAAGAVLYLSSDLATYCTGAVLACDGGCAAQATWGGAMPEILAMRQ